MEDTGSLVPWACPFLSFLPSHQSKLSLLCPSATDPKQQDQDTVEKAFKTISKANLSSFYMSISGIFSQWWKTDESILLVYTDKIFHFPANLLAFFEVFRLRLK